MLELIRRSDASELCALNVDTDVLLPDAFDALHFVDGRNLLPSARWDEVGLASQSLAHSWYKVAGTDPTIAFDLSFGQYIDYEMKRAFTVVCRQIALLTELQPSRIMFADDGSLVARASEAYALAHEVPIEKVPAASVSEGTEWYVAPSTARVGSRVERVEELISKASWFRRHFGGLKSLTFFVRPHGYASSFIDAIIRESRHRVIVTEFVRRYAGHPRVMFVDWRHARVPADALALGVKNWTTVDEAVARTDLSYLRVKLWPVMRHVAHSFWESAWSAFARQATCLSRAFDTLEPDAVVVAQDQTGFEKAMIMIAHQRHALTVAIDHGIGLYRSPGGLPPALARMLAVYGTECKRLADPAVPTIVTVGNDDLVDFARRVQSCDRESLRERIGVGSPSVSVILFAAGPYVNLIPRVEPSETNEILQAICRVAGKLENGVVLVRLHPGTSAYESAEVKRGIVEEYNRGNVLLDPGFTAAEALAASDIVVTVQSGFGVEAVAAQKPLVVFDPTRTDTVGYLRGGAGVGAHDECGLLRALQAIIDDPGYRSNLLQSGERFIRERVVGFGDGRAGGRLLAAIESALHEHSMVTA